MANISDYIDWRGDLDFSASPFNEVDNLVLSELCFIDFENIVPSPKDGGAVALGKAAEEFLKKNGPADKISMGLLIPDEIPLLLEKAASSHRFRDTYVRGYVNIVDTERQTQFSATTYLLGDGTEYVAFRGTDDTVVGWKEDFNMSFLSEVPAQTEAVAYLDIAACSSALPLRIGGHSKGGNLAIYAALKSIPQIQSRIINIYNNDGPGFKRPVREEPGYKRIAGKIITLTPHLSVVGSLLEHELNYDVVESDGKGLLQHDGFTWHVIGTRFVRLEDTSPASKRLEESLRNHLNELDTEQRKCFVNGLFGAIESTGASTLSEINEDRLRSAYKIAASIMSLDKKTRELVTKTLALLMKEISGIKAASKPAKQRQ